MAANGSVSKPSTARKASRQGHLAALLRGKLDADFFGEQPSSAPLVQSKQELFQYDDFPSSADPRLDPAVSSPTSASWQLWGSAGFPAPVHSAKLERPSSAVNRASSPWDSDKTQSSLNIRIPSGSRASDFDAFGSGPRSAVASSSSHRASVPVLGLLSPQPDRAPGRFGAGAGLRSPISAFSDYAEFPTSKRASNGGNGSSTLRSHLTASLRSGGGLRSAHDAVENADPLFGGRADSRSPGPISPVGTPVLGNRAHFLSKLVPPPRPSSTPPAHTIYNSAAAAAARSRLVNEFSPATTTASGGDLEEHSEQQLMFAMKHLGLEEERDESQQQQQQIRRATSPFLRSPYMGGTPIATPTQQIYDVYGTSVDGSLYEDDGLAPLRSPAYRNSVTGSPRRGDRAASVSVERPHRFSADFAAAKSPLRSNSLSVRGSRGSFAHPTLVIDPSHGGRSALLSEFRNSSKARKYELRDLAGSVVEFSGDQHGSRFIQQKLETASSEDKAMVFEEILPNALQLMTDVFGNYVIQKLFEHSSQVQKKILAALMEGHVLALSMQMYGCRVVQKALEHVLTEQQVALVRELDGHVLKCVKDQNGNHVVQKAIERVPARKIQFVIDAFHGQIYALATHPYGCRVVQRLFERCSEEQSYGALLEELHTHARALVQDQYGNYVMQHVLGSGAQADKARLIGEIRGAVVSLSKHKFASNVIEKCFAHGSREDHARLIDEIVADHGDGGEEGSDGPLVGMMKDQYANYVVQKMLDVLDGEQRRRLVDAIQPHLPELKKFSYGKHLVAKVERGAAARGSASAPSPRREEGGKWRRVSART